MYEKVTTQSHWYDTGAIREEKNGYGDHTGRIGSRQQVPVLGPVVAWGSSKGAWGFSVGRLDLKQLGFQGKPLF